MKGIPKTKTSVAYVYLIEQWSSDPYWSVDDARTSSSQREPARNPHVVIPKFNVQGKGGKVDIKELTTYLQMVGLTAMDEGEFKSAAQAARGFSHLNMDQMGYVYGLYKQAMEGDINVRQPWSLDLQGTMKWNSWNSMKGMDKGIARAAYVFLIREYNGEGRKNDLAIAAASAVHDKSHLNTTVEDMKSEERVAEHHTASSIKNSLHTPVSSWRSQTARQHNEQLGGESISGASDDDDDDTIMSFKSAIGDSPFRAPASPGRPYQKPSNGRTLFSGPRANNDAGVASVSDIDRGSSDVVSQGRYGSKQQGKYAAVPNESPNTMSTSVGPYQWCTRALNGCYSVALTPCQVCIPKASVPSSSSSAPRKSSERRRGSGASVDSAYFTKQKQQSAPNDVENGSASAVDGVMNPISGSSHGGVPGRKLYKPLIDINDEQTL